MIADILEGRLDAAILALPVSEPRLSEVPLFEEEFILVPSRPYPRDPRGPYPRTVRPRAGGGAHTNGPEGGLHGGLAAALVDDAARQLLEGHHRTQGVSGW